MALRAEAGHDDEIGAERHADAIRAGVAAILLCVVGFLLARATLFRETTVIVDAGGCRLVTDVVDAGEDDDAGVRHPVSRAGGE